MGSCVTLICYCWRLKYTIVCKVRRKQQQFYNEETEISTFPVGRPLVAVVIMTAAKEEVKLLVTWVYLPCCLFAGVWHTHRAKPCNYTKTLSLYANTVKETSPKPWLHLFEALNLHEMIHFTIRIWSNYTWKVLKSCTMKLLYPSSSQEVCSVLTLWARRGKLSFVGFKMRLRSFQECVDVIWHPRLTGAPRCVQCSNEK